MLLFLSAAAASCANTPSVAEASPCIRVDILELSTMATSSFIRSATEEKHQKGCTNLGHSEGLHGSHPLRVPPSLSLIRLGLLPVKGE